MENNKKRRKGKGGRGMESRSDRIRDIRGPA